MGRQAIFLYSIFLALFNSSLEKVKAESQSFICQTTVSYEVIKDGNESPSNVNFAFLSIKSSSEEEGYRELSALSISQRELAMEQCRRSYENSASCLSNKMEAMAPALSKMSFSARKEAEALAIEDCKKRSGRCLEAKHGEISCTKETIESAAPAEEEKNNDKGKDKGKGKK